MAVMDLETKQLTSFDPNNIRAGIALLENADLIVGHNIINFDLPVIEKLYPEFKTRAKIRDTIVCTRLIWPDLKETDFKTKQVTGKLVGSHSLKAWGVRLGELKGTYGEEENCWEHFSQEMLAYCEQDVSVTNSVWEAIKAKKYSKEAVSLEHDFATVISKMERFGFCFDEDRAMSLELQLLRELDDAKKDIGSIPPIEKLEEFIPKRDDKVKGYKAGEVFIKRKLVPFNHNSRDHIISLLKTKYNFNFEPVLKREKGSREKVEKIEITEESLEALPFKEGKILARFKKLTKIYGMVRGGANAWLNLVKSDKRIHGSVITNGAVTGRCTHNKPNMAQIPSAKKSKETGELVYGWDSGWGSDCRSLFTVPKGWKLVGADASGLELRCLAHYLSYWDGGEYTDQVLNGDIHTTNQKAAGLSTRDAAKTFIYAFIYGAGDEKLGSIVGGTIGAGKKLRASFLSKLPALGKLVKRVELLVNTQGYLTGLDGRRLHTKSTHSALNYLLQSAGAILMKKATALFYEKATENGWVFGVHYGLSAHVHDEMQVACLEHLAVPIGEALVQSIRDAGEYFNFRCPLDGEYKIGNNWAETH